MNPYFPDIKKLLNISLIQRYLTGRILRFIEEQRIARLLSSMGDFSMKEAVVAFKRELGYTLHDRVRLRMMKVLIDLLCECGHVEKKDGCYLWNEGKSADVVLSDEDCRVAKECFKGQVDFFESCISHADTFLRGDQPLYSFDSGDTRVWEDFLGNSEFNFARSVLAKLMLSKRGRMSTFSICVTGRASIYFRYRNNAQP